LGSLLPTFFRRYSWRLLSGSEMEGGSTSPLREDFSRFHPVLVPLHLASLINAIHLQWHVIGPERESIRRLLCELLFGELILRPLTLSLAHVFDHCLLDLLLVRFRLIFQLSDATFLIFLLDNGAPIFPKLLVQFVLLLLNVLNVLPNGMSLEFLILVPLLSSWVFFTPSSKEYDVLRLRDALSVVVRVLYCEIFQSLRLIMTSSRRKVRFQMLRHFLVRSSLSQASLQWQS